MWGTLSVLIICGTIIYLAHKYVQPYVKPEDDVKPEEKKETEDVDVVDVIQKIYNKLEE